jgi:hypothetical protein
MKRACRLGDGWYGLAKNIDDAVALIKKLRAMEKGYQRAKPLEITFGAQWLGLSVDDVRRMEEAGVERVLPSTELIARDSLGALRKVHEKLVSKF